MFLKLNDKQKRNWVLDRRKRHSAVMLSIAIVAIKKNQEVLYINASTILRFHRIYILTGNHNTSMVIFWEVNVNYLI